MRFSPPEEAISIYNDGFNEDLLGRKAVGQSLSDLLERIEDPLVVVLDGRWGAGKTHFLQRWVGAHRLQFGGRAETVYFDAFAHDFLEDPLIALVGAIAERMPRQQKTKVERVKRLALKVWRPAARIGLSAATFGATEVFGDLGDAVAEAVGSEASKAVDEFWKKEEDRRSAMAEFQNAIASLMAADQANDNEPRPLVIVIDELDRCRPDYALQILEIIKHFFSVQRLHFVLGVNLKALENSVKARYGADLNATLYLQKFISVTFGLPEVLGVNGESTAPLTFAEHMGPKMGIPSRWLSTVSGHVKVVSKTNEVSIRDVSRVLSRISLMPKKYLEGNILSGWAEVAVTLLVSKEVRPDLYGKFVASTVTDEELAEYFGATPEKLTQRVDGSYSDKYEHDVFWRYLTWQFITRDGKMKSDENLEGLTRTLSTHGHVYNPRELPKNIQRDWLDLFRTA